MRTRLAEILMLGRADPYDIHIAWRSETRTIPDEDGNVIRAQGYPGS